MKLRLIGILGYLKDSNAATHSVDSDIFYLSARSKTYNNFISQSSVELCCVT